MTTLAFDAAGCILMLQAGEFTRERLEALVSALSGAFAILPPVLRG